MTSKRDLEDRIEKLEKAVNGSAFLTGLTDQVDRLLVTDRAGVTMKVPVVDASGKHTKDWQASYQYSDVLVENVVRWLAKENGKKLVIRADIKGDLDLTEVKM